MSDVALIDGICDTHMHIYDDRYAVAASATLQPPDASPADYRRVQAQLGMQRVVVVQPTTYGLDNSCTLDAVSEFGPTARAVVVVDDQLSRGRLDVLHDAGARGARFHMLPGGAVAWDQLATIAALIADRGWHVQLQLNGHELTDRFEALAALPTPLVIDHVGRFMPPAEPDNDSFLALLRLVDTGRCWVKVSAPYESELDALHRYPAVGRLARTLLQHAPERMLWATNWPHPGQRDPPTANDLARLRNEWLTHDTLRRQVLVDNPAELYGF